MLIFLNRIQTEIWGIRDTLLIEPRTGSITNEYERISNGMLTSFCSLLLHVIRLIYTDDKSVEVEDVILMKK